jgi:hypothetical protein
VTYTEWFMQHGQKHQAIVDKLSHLSDLELIEYFRFDNMVEKEPEFCELYKENRKCHDVEGLNCYICGCPNFRFKEEGYRKMDGKMLFSTCSINSKEGDRFITEDAIHQDCTKCMVPHYESYIKKVFSRDWFEMMGDVVPYEDDED